MTRSETGPEAGGGDAAPAELETVRARAPYVLRRRVKWGEVDYARIVYTARFADYAMEAVEFWFRDTVGHAWSDNLARFGFGAPAGGLSLEFLYPLYPDDVLDTEVRLARIGRSSYTLAVTGRNGAGTRCFTGTVRFVTIDPEGWAAIPIPEVLRTALEAYRAACGDDAPADD